MFTMLKKNTKYIPSHTFEKESNNNNDVNVNKIIETKLEDFNNGNIDPKSDYYSDTYRVTKLNCSSHRKAFIVRYMFTYEENVETKDISRGYRTVYHAAIEDDNWSADSVEQAILYTYKNFGKSYAFKEKYGNVKNLKLLGVYDVYVKIHYSYVPDCYSGRESTWNNEFREEYNKE